MKLLLTN